MQPNDHPMLRVLLAKPRGFCAGVERAIEIVERALALYGPPVYVRHEIVHNKHVVDRCAPKVLCSSRNWTRSRRARSPCSARMASPPRSRRSGAGTSR